MWATPFLDLRYRVEAYAEYFTMHTVLVGVYTFLLLKLAVNIKISRKDLGQKNIVF